MCIPIPVLFFVEAGVCLLTAGLLWVLFRDHTQSPDETDEKPQTDMTAHEHALPGSGSPCQDYIFLTVCVLAMLLITVLAQLFGTYPLTIYEVYRLPEYTVGLVFTLNTLVIVVFQMVVIRMVERFDTLRVVGVGAFLLCGGFSLLQFTSSLALIRLTVLVWTLGEMLTTPLLEGFVAERSPIASRGQYMGMFSAAFSGAFVLAPLGGTWVYEVFGYRTLWWTCGVIGVGLWIGFTWLNTKVQQERKQEISRTYSAGEGET